jgi:hypothetical protein
VVEILNQYLPKDKKLYGSMERIEEEEDCREYLFDEWKQQSKDSTKTKQQTPHNKVLPKQR